MKSKIIIGFFVLLVSTIMLMSNASGSGWPVAWINQATLSTIDFFPSENPENSGFGPIQAVVWQEWNGNDWDIHMSWSNADGALGSWAGPGGGVQPATIFGRDEINPAVTVTNVNPISGFTEIHVVYQRWNLVSLQWDICHTWVNIIVGVWVWSAVTVLDTAVANDAINPAVVYTDDLSNPGIGLGMLVQFTWAEINPGTGLYEIQYDAYYYDPTLIPPRALVGVTLVRACLFGNCEVPEISSIDETLTIGIYDYYFAVVWQEPNAAGQLNVWYIDGTTTTSPGAPATVLTPGSLGQINPVNVIGDSFDPDIAVTQDYQGAVGVETYYFHIDWVFNIWAVPPNPAFYQIDTCYSVGVVPTPGAASFIATVPARGPIANPNILDRPTIASKVIGLAPTIFESWMCWEDNNMPGSNPEIWYAVGTYTVGAPAFIFTAPAARVGYNPVAGGLEFNPELWNRDDSTRLMPPLTHLVFDQNLVPVGTIEVEYIDP